MRDRQTRQPFLLDEAVDLLGRTPATLDSMLRGIPESWQGAHEGGETWSPFDVVGHLVHGERTDWLPRVRMILEHGDRRAFPPFDRFAQFEASKGLSLVTLLDTFAALRRDSLRGLSALNLTDADLERRGRHPAFGPVTLQQLLATWVAHDLDHIVQVARVLARQYTDQVGPWRAYLRIIGDVTASP